MGVTYKARDIANWFIKTGKSNNNCLTHAQLQKLVYYSHAWNLAYHDEALIKEPIEAWMYGPVVCDMYHELKRTNGAPLKKELEDAKQICGSKVNLLQAVYNKYAHLSGGALIQRTHAKDSPWSKVYQPYVYNKIIPNSLIKSHFDKYVKKA